MVDLNILLIDDDVLFKRHVSLYAKHKGWSVTSVTLLNKKILADNNFNMVVLDYSGGNQDFKKNLSLLKELGLIDKTVLISGVNDISRHAKKHSIYYYLKKPIKLGTDIEKSYDKIRIKNNECLKEENIWDENLESFDDWVNNLSPAITIHCDETLEIIKENKSAKKNKITASQYRTLSLMEVELLEQETKEAKREDWDDNKGMWLHSRLFDVGNSYWYTRQWYDSEIDHLSGLDPNKTLKCVFYEAVNRLKQWGITRSRLYVVDTFYDDSKGNKKDYLLTPLYQQGDGLTDVHQWFNTVFTYSNNNNLKSVFKLSKDEFYDLQPVSGQGDNGCDAIDWGDEKNEARAGTRAEIPIRRKTKTGADQYLALLTIDQRLDHLPDKTIAYLNYAGDKDSSIGIPPLTVEEMLLMKGYITKQLTPKLMEIFKEIKKDNLTKWHEIISEKVNENIKNEKQNAERTFKDILSDLIAAWPQVENITGNKEGQSTLLNWYFIKEEVGDQIAVVTGFGELAENRLERRYFNNLPPFTEALISNPEYGYAIQNFRKWSETDINKKSIGLYIGGSSKKSDYIKKIKSWYGFPFKLKGDKYLMVVHSSSENYFTSHRTKLLKNACRRLAPKLLWLIAEKSRVWFHRALTHELNTPIALANQIMSDGNEKNKAQRLFHTINMIEAMVNNVRRITDFDKQSEMKFSNIDTTLNDVFEALVFLIHWGKDDYEIDLKISPSLKGNHYKQYFRTLELSVDTQVLKEVLFNLLHNAYKYSLGRCNNIYLNIDKNDKGDKLIIIIKNSCKKLLKKEELTRIFLPYYRVKGLGESGAGLGLAVVKKLCEQNNMLCYPLETEKEKNIYYQSFRLEVPVKKLGENKCV